LIRILEYLKKHGQLLDTDIAKEMGMSVATVRQRVASLRATGAVVTCDLTRFENGKQTQAWVCRASGYTPPPAPGRKAKPITKAPPA
jgi:predicted ArsR family transcriptional regulator